MQQLVTHRRRENIVRYLIPLFFVSGATGLAYQILWMRELQLVFGTSTFAISALLAAFMGGLAAGGLVVARQAHRIKRHLFLYGLLELGIGLYALIFPVLLALGTPVYLAAGQATAPGTTVFALIQLAIMITLLILPTAAMGATLPLLARFCVDRIRRAGDRIGTLYAVNTAGAVVGIGVCGFLLLPQLGITRTTLVVAAANILLGLAALVLASKPASNVPRANDKPGIADVDMSVMVPVAAAIGLAGFAALVYEVAWTRLLALMLGSGTHTFSVMLIAFLAGIAAGARIGGPFADRILASGGLRLVLHAFAWVEICIAGLAYCTMYLYQQLPFWYVQLFDLFGAGNRLESIWWVSLLLAGIVMTLPAVLMGAHFPLAVRAVAGRGARMDQHVGVIYGINALGGALGAFIAGFVLLPHLGIQGTVFVAVAGGFLAAGILFAKSAARSHRPRALFVPLALAGLTVLFFAQRPPWQPLLMTAGLYHYAALIEDHSREGIRAKSVDPYELLYYEEGLSSVVTVAENKGSGHRWLAINGKVDASTAEDMPTQVLLSLLPMQFVNEPQDVLIIGLASGVTAGSASLLPEIGKLQIVELEPAIGRAARYFDSWNHSVLSDPRVELVFNDGRNHLLLAAPETFDIIISEPSNPWISGVANLFTREFLEIGKSRLKTGGAWSQWVPIYGMDSDDLLSILKTFSEVYPHVLVYASIAYNDLILIGSDAPLSLSGNPQGRLLANPLLVSELHRANIRSDIELLSLFLMDSKRIMEMSGEARTNTDDNMYIEFSTARKLHQETRGENFDLLLKNAQLPNAAFDDDTGKWFRLAAIYRRNGDIVRATDAIKRGRELSSTAHPTSN